MKLKDVQCKKISFCGKKLRLLGKVSCTVHCVVSGSFLGNFNFKASVIKDLKFHFDTLCVVGAQLSLMLNPDCGQDISSAEIDDQKFFSSLSSSSSTPSASPTSTPRRTTPARTTATSSTARTPATSSAARPSACPSSPPGFPYRPQFCNAIAKQKRPEINVSIGNVYSYSYSNVFADADLQPTSNAEVCALLQTDPGGKLVKWSNSVHDVYWIHLRDGTWSRQVQIFPLCDKRWQLKLYH